MAHDDECGCDRCAEWETLHSGKTEPVQHTLSDDAWRKFYAGVAMGLMMVADNTTNHIRAATAVQHADALLAELKHTEAAETSPRRGGLETEHGETQ